MIDTYTPIYFLANSCLRIRPISEAARLNPCELRTVVQYTYTLSERSAEVHGRRSGGVLGFIFVTELFDSVAALKARDKSYDCIAIELKNSYTTDYDDNPASAAVVA
ncbi:hypothetical protein EVAR_60265_1 [Eumeta japonica]|uniref:Uncharacterized protein n=1 Tax=Eumeta variegata TaxID=151549 RepID=A0A4C1Z326_EUMVA|nr:hypothetical protein EVAR_60265_1 [Eumeta japonica]